LIICIIDSINTNSDIKSSIIDKEDHKTHNDPSEDTFKEEFGVEELVFLSRDIKTWKSDAEFWIEVLLDDS